MIGIVPHHGCCTYLYTESFLICIMSKVLNKSRRLGCIVIMVRILRTIDMSQKSTITYSKARAGLQEAKIF
jgi:hypothetical protein